MPWRNHEHSADRHHSRHRSTRRSRVNSCRLGDACGGRSGASGPCARGFLYRAARPSLPIMRFCRYTADGLLPIRESAAGLCLDYRLAVLRFAAGRLAHRPARSRAPDWPGNSAYYGHFSHRARSSRRKDHYPLWAQSPRSRPGLRTGSRVGVVRTGGIGCPDTGVLPGCRRPKTSLVCGIRVLRCTKGFTNCFGEICVTLA